MPSRKDVATTSHMPEFEQWVMAMTNQAEDIEQDGEFDPRALMVAATHTATFEEAVELLNGSSIQNGKNLVGIVQTIVGYKLRKSDEKYANQGMQLGVYAVIDGVTAEGVPLIWATGAPNILAILWQADKFDRFPLRAVVTAKETANGELLSLKPLTS